MEEDEGGRGRRGSSGGRERGRRGEGCETVGGARLVTGDDGDEWQREVKHVEG